MNLCNVLITSAGRRVSLVRLFQKAIQELQLDGLVYAVDLQANAPALHVADGWKTVPRVTEKKYLDRLLMFCKKYQISLVVPTIDTELHILASARDKFAAEGVLLLVCSNNVNQIAFDKRSTQRFFEDNKFSMPKLFSADEALELSSNLYPLLLKPARGSCSVGVTKVNNHKELSFFLDYLDDPIIQEFVSGDEFTFDVLIGLDGSVLSVVPRLRIETRAGEVSKSVTVKDSRMIDSVWQVADTLQGAVGCVTIQAFRLADGDLRFIEINPRFGGGFPLSAEAGADFPRWILQMVMGISVDQSLQNSWQDGRVMLRYDDAIIVDQIQLESCLR